VTAVYLPHTDHAFDVMGTKWSPAARVAFHVLERFLAGISAAVDSVAQSQRMPSDAARLSKASDARADAHAAR